jgi:predicted ATPase
LIDPQHVVSTVAATLGLKDVVGISLTEVIVRYVERKRMLLVLDNFEHVLGAAGFVAALVAQCPACYVLVTSRSALQLSAEQRVEVRPLPTPAQDGLDDFEVVAGQPAVRLFVERTRAVRETFALDPRTAAAVGAICARLDGLPLAIELAAAWVRVFPPQALLRRLSPKLGLLAGGASDRPARHQTLRATIDWSYDLLTRSEQRLFARLSVFAGGCTFDAVQQVCTPDEDLELLPNLTSLVDKSLVRQVGEREPRFSLLETLREYAADKLAEHGDRDRLRQLHALHVEASARQVVPLLVGPRQFEILQDLDAELDNVRTALSWFFSNRIASSRSWDWRPRCTASGWRAACAARRASGWRPGWLAAPESRTRAGRRRCWRWAGWLSSTAVSTAPGARWRKRSRRSARWATRPASAR